MINEAFAAATLSLTMAQSFIVHRITPHVQFAREFEGRGKAVCGVGFETRQQREFGYVMRADGTRIWVSGQDRFEIVWEAVCANLKGFSEPDWLTIVRPSPLLSRAHSKRTR